jgi:hypothetical protein
MPSPEWNSLPVGTVVIISAQRVLTEELSAKEALEEPGEIGRRGNGTAGVPKWRGPEPGAGTRVGQAERDHDAVADLISHLTDPHLREDLAQDAVAHPGADATLTP